MNTLRLTNRTVVLIEQALDEFRAIATDRVVTPEEFDAYEARLIEAAYTAGMADSSLATGLSWIHNGVDARRSRDLTRDYEQTYHGAPVDIDQFRRTTKKRRSGGNQNDAA
jgi:hypothetical protein